MGQSNSKDLFMEVIFKERSLIAESRLKQSDKGQINCCCRHVLEGIYSELTAVLPCRELESRLTGTIHHLDLLVFMWENYRFS